MKRFHDKPNRYVTQIVLRVKNFKRSLEFYNKIMGFDILEERKNEAILTADGSTPIVTLIQPEDIIEKVPKRTGLYHFAILLPNRLQLGLFLKNLEEKDYPTIGGSDHGVSEAIYLQDPDDNGIEVYSDVDSNEWKWKNGRGADTLPQNSAGMEYYTIIFPDEEFRKERIDNLIKLGYKAIEKENNLFAKDPTGNFIKLTFS